MNEDQYRDMVIDHDKHIDSLTSSVAVLASNVGSTNKKLDDMILVINKQNVLTERMSNLDHNFKESFGRVHSKIEDLEDNQKLNVSSTTVKWFIGITLSYAITFGTFVTTELQSLHIIAVEKIQMQRQINKNINEKLEHLTNIHDKD